MLPVFRWCLCGLGALWGCAAWAQTAASQPEIDESKIPEWVKRQARSPYKVIIDSNSIKPKPVPAPPPAPVKDDASAKVANKKPAPVKTAAPAAADKNPPVTASAEPPAADSTLGNSAAVLPTPAISAPPGANELAPAEPDARSARLGGSEPPALTVVKRVEPTLPADLIDSRLATAKVVVAFTVTTNGEVSNLSIASTTDPRLNRSILRAVQAWRYAPIPEPRENMVSFAFKTE
jgi:TonB family protein